MRKTILIIIAAIAFFVAGCAITGKTSAVLKDEILGCGIDTQIDILKIDDIEQACYKDNGVFFAVENMGSTSISGFSVFLESDYNITMNIRSSLKPGETKQEQLFFGNQKLNGIKSLSISPSIEGNICDMAGIRLEIRRC
jgi:hypothetical protein